MAKKPGLKKQLECIAELGSEPLHAPVRFSWRKKKVLAWVDVDGLWLRPEFGYKAIEAVFVPFNTLAEVHVGEIDEEGL